MVVTSAGSRGWRAASGGRLGSACRVAGWRVRWPTRPRQIGMVGPRMYMDWDAIQKTGDWVADPWFVSSDVGFEEEWEAIGLPRAARIAAVEPLRRIFPPEVCREIFADETYRRFGPVVSLFGWSRWPGTVAPLLHLGLDAAVAQPWDDVATLKRLRYREGHDEVAFEIAVHAGLARAGFRVERVPETPAGKRPDFRVAVGGSTYDIEVKLVNEPELDRIAEELSWGFRASDLMVPGFHLRLWASRELSERALSSARSLSSEFPAIRAAVGKAAESLRANPAPGRHDVPGVGWIEAIPSRGLGSWEDRFLPDLSEERKAERIVHGVLKKAMAKFSGDARGIVVLGLFHAAQPALVQKMAVEVLGQDTRSSACKLVVLCDRFTRPSASRIRWSAPAFYAFSPRPYRKIRRAELQIAEAAASRRGAKAVRWVDAPAGQAGLPVTTGRERRTLRSAGRISGPAEAGTVFSFSINGRGETRTEVRPPNRRSGSNGLD